MCHKRNAFTLIEVLTVTVIIALVVAVLVPTVGAMRRGDERPDLPAFARHRGLMNVAFTDGSVKLMKPEDIDPVNEDVSKAYWLP